VDGRVGFLGGLVVGIVLLAGDLVVGVVQQIQSLVQPALVVAALAHAL
jgi:hypothetical protein